MNSGEYKEKRRFPRAPVSIKASFRLAGDAPENNLDGTITVLGQGGCFLQTKTAFSKGTKLVVNFELEGKPLELEADVRCQIQYSWTSKKAQYPGMGMAFLNAPADVQALIAGYVDRVLKSAGVS